jgi:hypothetical protein
MKGKRKMKFCFSCAAPLYLPDFQGPAENYCKHCTDDAGNLKPKNEIQMGVAEWFKVWQPDLTHEKAAARAEHYMKAMPAWAD